MTFEEKNLLEIEHHQLISIFDSIDEAIYVCDPDTHEVLYANQALKDIFDHEIVGRKCYRTFQNLKKPCSFCTNKYIFGENAGKSYTWEFFNKQTGHWFRCIDKAIRWPDGRLVRYEMAIDIDEGKKALEKLERERSFTKGALDAIPDVFAVFDLEWNMLKWNRAFSEVTGYGDDEIQEMKISDIFDETELQRIKKETNSIVKTGYNRFETVITTRNGDRIPYDVTGALIVDPDGNPAICEIAKNATDVKRTEEALHKLINETNERRQEISALLESTRFVLAHTDFEVAARDIFSVCRKLIGAEAGFVSIMKKDGSGEDEILFIYPERLRRGVDPSASMPVTRLSREVFETGRAVYENILDIDRWEKDLPEGHFRVQNVLFAPLMTGKKVEGVVGLANKPGGFHAGDALMASAFGEIASLALKNSRILELLIDSEAQFRSVIETASDAIISGNSKGFIVSWNQGAERMFGYSPDEAVGQSLTLIMPEKSRAFNRDLLRKARKSKNWDIPSKTFEQKGLRKDGSEFPIEVSVSLWSVGGQDHFTVIIRDISKRKTAEEALRSSEEMYRSLLTASPDAVTVTDTDANILYASQRTAQIHGYDNTSELEGMSALELVSPDMRSRAAMELVEALEKGHIENREFVGLRKDGSRFYMEVNAAAVMDAEGNPVAFIANSHDISERKHAEQLLQNLNVELEGYAHAVSHDLKGPLSAIGAASETIKSAVEKPPSDEVVSALKEMSNIIAENVVKADKLTESLLSLAEAGQTPDEVTDVDVNEIVKMVLDEMASRISEKGARVEVSPELQTIRANFTHVYQIFSNLIKNALDHNDSRKPFVEVRSLEPDEAGIHRYLVRDNGSGIPPDIMDKIFFPLFKGAGGKTGIGLATVEKIVNIYNGSIRAYNDEGACFEFTLRDFPGK